MLVTVLNCYQREEVKWKDLSGQVIALLLPLLANQKVEFFIRIHNYKSANNSRSSDNCPLKFRF